MKELLLSDLGIAGDGTLYRNLPPSALVQKAIERGEGELSDTGALAVKTGKYTGRSPKDKFIVDTETVHDKIAWGKTNVPIDEKYFEGIRAKLLAYLQGKEVFVFDGFAGADRRYAQKFRVINELAFQNLFIHQLLIPPGDEQLEEFSPDFTIYAAPGFQCIPSVDGVHSEAAIMINYKSREVLIAGSCYCGEIKKSVFSVMNYVLPQMGVLPMHCSANVGEAGDSAVFFGLSGTGKTTLSADPGRKLVGDDEHAWSDDGVFNIEGGCYAKCINLKKEHEPEIYQAIRFGAVLENVVMRDDGRPDYADASITENTRAGYPIGYIPNALIPGIAGAPKTVIFLTADAFGVIPPIAKLDNDMAMYHFVSGYTSKLAGTERGVKQPEATFSTLFGEPFFPMSAAVYTAMLGEKLKRAGANVFLVNTGWCGGAAGEVPRIPLKYTRAMVAAAISGKLNDVDYALDPIFHVYIPKSCPDVPKEILDPRNVWKDKGKYEAAAKELAEKFQKNFAEKYQDMPERVVRAGPRPGKEPVSARI